MLGDNFSYFTVNCDKLRDELYIERCKSMGLEVRHNICVYIDTREQASARSTVIGHITLEFDRLIVDEF